MKKRSWTAENLKNAVRTSKSIRQTLKKLGLKEAGGNYSQVSKYIKEFELDSSHFTGKGWNKGLKIPGRPKFSLEEILIEKSYFQSYKLKRRLFIAKLMKEQCEECGWAERAEDGRIPVELDHINGDSRDNRLENLRVLCPNCHSLKPTHRGKNKQKGSVAEWHTRST